MNIKTTALASSITFLTACNGSSIAPISPSFSSSTSKLTVNLTDAPIDEANNVYVSLSGVSLNYEDGGWVEYDFENPQKIDLLSLQSGNTLTLLDDIDVEPGSYRVRLKLHKDDDNELDNSIVLNEGGAEHELTIPSGDQRGIQLDKAIVVPANGSANYTIDFDVRKSIVKRGQDHNYLLKPILRIVDNSESGSISGTIDDTDWLVDNCSDADPLTNNTIYIFEGSDITFDDIGSEGAQAVTTTPVNYDEGTGVYGYQASFLLAGEYSLAFTCNSDLEDIEADDELSFISLGNVTVTADTNAVEETSEEG